MELMPEDELRRSFEINVIGPMSLTRQLLPLLGTARGRIVNIGGLAAHTATPFYGAIAATKSALASFSDALRMECAMFGAKVMLIEPGALQTEIFEVAVRAQAAALEMLPKQSVELYKDEMDAVRNTFTKFPAVVSIDKRWVITNSMVLCLFSTLSSSVAWQKWITKP